MSSGILRAGKRRAMTDATDRFIADRAANLRSVAGLPS